MQARTSKWFRNLFIAAIVVAASTLGNTASAQVISGSQIVFTGNASNPEYHAEVFQTIAGDFTGINFNYTGTTLTFDGVAADEGSDWYLANAGDVFSATTITASQFPILFTDANLFGPTLTIPLGDFYLGMNTGTGSSNSPTFRDVYGWIELDNTGSALIPVDNAVAYGDQGIIIGTTTAVPEPGSAAIAMLAALPLLLKRSNRMELLRRSLTISTGLALLAMLPLVGPTYADGVPLLHINPSTQIITAFVPLGPEQFPGLNESHGNGMVGWTFILLQPVTITQVGIYDDGQDGLSRSYQVGLWESPSLTFATSSGQLLGDPSTGIIVPGGTTAPLNGEWRVVDLPTPLALQPGDYELGDLDTSSTTDVIKYADMDNQVNYTADPAITDNLLTIYAPFAGDLPGIDGAGFGLSSDFFLTYGVEFGPMLFTVPEPSTLSISGLAAAFLIMRRQNRTNPKITKRSKRT